MCTIYEARERLRRPRTNWIDVVFAAVIAFGAGYMLAPRAAPIKVAGALHYTFADCPPAPKSPYDGGHVPAPKYPPRTSRNAWDIVTMPDHVSPPPRAREKNTNRGRPKGS